MAKLGIVVIGVGRWGTHLTRKFAAHPEAELLAIVEANAEQRQRCREKLQLPDSVKLLADWSEAAKLPGLEAIALATPASTHYPLIADALQRGYHVLAEKPLTLDPAECVALCQLAARQQRQLFIDHTYLFNPAVEQGRAVVASGQLGDLRYGYAARTHLSPVRQDVDALWDLAIHDIAIFNYWLGRSPVEVRAQGQAWLQPQRTMTVAGEAQSPGLCDLVWLTLTYPDGWQATVHLCWLNPDKQRRLCLVGSQGSLIFDELHAEPLRLQRGRFEQQGELFVPQGVATEAIAVPAGEPLQNVCDQFLASVASGQPSPLSDGWVGAELVNVLVAASRSLEQDGAAIAIPPLAKTAETDPRLTRKP
ncbi:MAG: Gfo/Idh/MocA family oxidoreductase [Spirulinaceae cyanobacterium SM2_1_0]|nr:Gfo/Idh/MocA family oxidoreductase [Spirulinaceae cyanobacterium SM2_1_0]